VAAELKREFGVDAKQTFDAKTKFDVRIDGETVFSAATCGHLPKPGEVTAVIRKLDREGSARPAG
jgi:hypothetical protein